MAMKTNELNTIRLYGQLGAMFGRVHRLAVNSPREAIRALSIILPGFEHFMMTSKQRGLVYAVFKGKRNIGLEELKDNSGTQDIRIAPVISGNKRAGMFQIVLGAVLIAATIISMGSFAAIAASTWASMALMTGVSMVMGGVMQMLSPQPKGLSMGQDPDNKPSYAFGGPVNTTAQGNPVGVLYGQREIGGAVISAGIYAEEQQ
ncbi:tail assembly protein [Edaphovirga cremea]|uniref:tail assembly protein n=1 Tax=Edaphovirga cremea TaxID=2267246 RepID=UPI000DEF56F5|nr:tail assembly protein [Edaphovirga cremea]